MRNWCLRTVSYTHLDVYKRQCTALGQPGQRGNKTDPAGIHPVSYTHLDVYKRQLLVGIFLEAEPKVGSWMDFITIIVVPFGAVLGAVSIYYILGFDEIKKELELGRDKPLGRFFGPLAKYGYVPLAVIVFILGLVYGGIG